MSCSTCIKCDKMVFFYEKYCDECITKYKLKQDENWHKSNPDSYENSQQEFEKDKLLPPTKQQ